MGRVLVGPGGRRFSTCVTISAKAKAAGESAPELRKGAPASPPATTRGSSGTEPRKGSSKASAVRLPPPLPKISAVSPQCGHTKPDMFSTRPKIGIFTVLQKLMDLRTSASATSCGVVTIRACTFGMVWATESGSSPVPGGASTTR